IWMKTRRRRFRNRWPDQAATRVAGLCSRRLTCCGNTSRKHSTGKTSQRQISASRLGHTRHELARNRFGILRTGAGTGHFVMKRELKSLAPSMFSNQTAWFEDFNAWQTEAFWNDLRSSARLLTSSSDPKAAGLGTRLATIVGEFPGGQNAVAFERLEGMGEEVRAFAAMLKDETDSSIRSAITQVVARNKLLLDRLAEFVSGL